jgi:outer membrane immunogenic protein
MIKQALAVSLLCTAVSVTAVGVTPIGPAAAADLEIMPSRAVVPTLVFNWTGWNVGAFLGGATSRNSSISDPCSHFLGCWLTPAGGEVVSYSMGNSAVGGINAGYYYQIPGSAIVFGVETEFAYINLKGSSSFAGVSGVAFAGNVVGTTTIGPWYNATTARVGWAYDRLYFYGKAGFAISTMEASIEDTRGGFASATAKKDLMGWAWGGGLEYALFDRWSLKAEYLWLGLNHTAGVCSVVAPGFGGPPVVPGPSAEVCSTANTTAVQSFKLGFNYLLNAGPSYSRY